MLGGAFADDSRWKQLLNGLIVTAPLLAGTALAEQAPAPNLQDLERRIEEAKRQQAQQEEAARKAAGRRAAERTRPGAVFRDALRKGGEGPEMVIIAAGSFRMGDLAGNGESDEKPVHEVRIAKAFALGKYEVTFEEYDAFAQATGRQQPGDEGWGRGKRPVIHVNWEDAAAYADWLSGQTGKRYRLPSEAEWEYAARAGSTTVYSFGNAPENVCTFGNVPDITTRTIPGTSYWEDIANCRDGYAQTAPAGSFKPNAFGLYDMHGNVWEWVEDCYARYDGAPADGSARTDCGSREHVFRGGGWGYGLARVRSAQRASNSGGGYEVGFRLAKDLP